jgi:hypothetical protein
MLVRFDGVYMPVIQDSGFEERHFLRVSSVALPISPSPDPTAWMCRPLWQVDFMHIADHVFQEV